MIHVGLLNAELMGGYMCWSCFKKNRLEKYPPLGKLILPLLLVLLLGLLYWYYYVNGLCYGRGFFVKLKSRVSLRNKFS